jgi:hypothetical protein
MLNGLPGYANAIALNEDLTRLKHITGADLEQARGVQDDRCRLLSVSRVSR